MTTESEIYESNPTEIATDSGFYNFKLLKTKANTTLYRASKAGKFFCIKTTKDKSERQLAMLRREYELSIGCDHPNIAHIYTYEYNTAVGKGIIMEYIEGRTLTEFLAEPPPDIIIGLGYSDDALSLTAALKKISSSITPELMELSKKQCGELIGPVDDKVIGEIKTQLKDNKDTEESLISQGKFHND